VLVVDDRTPARLVTSSDIERITTRPSRRKPARDSQFRLVVGAAISPVRKPDGSSIATRSSTMSARWSTRLSILSPSPRHGHTAASGDVVKFPRPSSRICLSSPAT